MRGRTVPAATAGALDSRARPSRRTLLVGGAGIVVGAGGVEVAGLLIHGDGAGTGPAVASPGEELMVEHGVLKRVLLAYRAIHDRLSGGKSVPFDVIMDSAQLISDYIESFHEGLEEAYVFPRVAEQQSTLVRTLLVQHDRGRHLTAAILTAAAEADTPEVRNGLIADIGLFVRMYEPHEAWEDTVIYPTLRAVTPQRTLDLLAERFADLENAQYGDSALAQMLTRLGGVETRLGIHDLAAFTPPGTTRDR